MAVDIKDWGVGWLTQTATSIGLNLPSIGSFIERASGQLLGSAERQFGEAFVSEGINHLKNSGARSVTEVLYRRYHERKGMLRGVDMSNEKKGGQKQSGNTGQPKIGVPSKGKDLVRQLPDALQPGIDKVLREEIEDRDLRQLCYAVIATRQMQSFINTAKVVIQAPAGKRRELLLEELDLLSVDFHSAGGGLASPRAKSDADKAAKILMQLDSKLRGKILAVTADASNDSADDQVNFNARLASLYGDGSDDAMNNANKVLVDLAKMPESKRRAWFGVRPNPLTSLKKIPQSIGKVAKSLTKGGYTKDSAQRVTEAYEQLEKDLGL